MGAKGKTWGATYSSAPPSPVSSSSSSCWSDGASNMSPCLALVAVKTTVVVPRPVLATALAEGMILVPSSAIVPDVRIPHLSAVLEPARIFTARKLFIEDILVKTVWHGILVGLRDRFLVGIRLGESQELALCDVIEFHCDIVRSWDSFQRSNLRENVENGRIYYSTSSDSKSATHC